MGDGMAQGHGRRCLTAEGGVGGKVDSDIIFPLPHNAKYNCPCENASLLMMSIILT